MKFAYAVTASLVAAASAMPTWCSLGQLPSKGRSCDWTSTYRQTVVDIESELKRIGLEELDVTNYATTENPADVEYYMGGMRALSPDSFIVRKAYAIASVLRSTSFPPPSMVIEYGAEFFALEYVPTWVASYFRNEGDAWVASMNALGLSRSS